MNNIKIFASIRNERDSMLRECRDLIISQIPAPSLYFKYLDKQFTIFYDLTEEMIIHYQTEFKDIQLSLENFKIDPIVIDSMKKLPMTPKRILIQFIMKCQSLVMYNTFNPLVLFFGNLVKVQFMEFANTIFTKLDEIVSNLGIEDPELKVEI